MHSCTMLYTYCTTLWSSLKTDLFILDLERLWVEFLKGNYINFTREWKMKVWKKKAVGNTIN